MADHEIRALLDFATDKATVQPQSSQPDFDALESEIADRFPSDVRLSYPAAIRSLYVWSFRHAAIGPIRLIDAPAVEPLRVLRQQIFESYDPAAIAGEGLLVIADDANDGGPLCLRAQRGVPAEQWDVWLWDHEDRTTTDRLFSSADKLIEVMQAMRGGRTVLSAADLDPGTDLAGRYGWWDAE